LQLPEELVRVDAMLDDPVFFSPFVPFFDPRMVWFPPNRGGFPYAASRLGAAVFS
jgi:hypothetical protein